MTTLRSLCCFVSALVLAVAAAPARASADETLPYRAEVDLRAVDGQGRQAALLHQVQAFRMQLLFQEGDSGPAHLRLERQAATGVLQVPGLPDEDLAREAGVDYLVVDEQGLLRSVLPLAGDLVLRPGEAPRLKRGEQSGTHHVVLPLDYPRGASLPAVITVQAGREGGQDEAGSAWREFSLSIRGNVQLAGQVQGGQVQGLLSLEGRGRLVLSRDGSRLVAFDYTADARVEDEGSLTARAESRVSVRLQDPRYDGVPAFGMRTTPAQQAPEGRWAALPRRGAQPFAASFALLALAGAGGWVLRERRGRYRRLERLLCAALVPAMVLAAAPAFGWSWPDFKLDFGPKVDAITGGVTAAAGAAMSGYVIWSFATVPAGWGAFAFFTAGWILVPMFIAGVVIAVAGVATLYKAQKRKQAIATLADAQTSEADRAMAAQRLGKEGHRADLDPLLVGLADASPLVRFQVLQAVGALGDKAVNQAMARIDALLAQEANADVVAAARALKAQVQGLQGLPAPAPTSR